MERLTGRLACGGLPLRDGTGGLAARTRPGRLARGVRALARDQRGQGTTEYAILVGVLVVIAIVAIIAFRGKVQELWDAIANGINSL